MQEIIKLAHDIENELTDIYNEIENIQENGFVYARAKNIRKAAQEIKVHAQNLRILTTEEFKKLQKKQYTK